MENAVEALKYAASILIFIIAITVFFSMLSTAKNTSDAIITMSDNQRYLESAELGNGILYTSTENVESGQINGVTTQGDRIVQVDDVISTMYRYSKEKYGVTIIKEDGTILARFDSNTEKIMQVYSSISSEKINDYLEILNNNTSNTYETHNFKESKSGYNNALEEIYSVKINSIIKIGAPWLGNDEEIIKRINCDIYGGIYSYNNAEYEGKNLIESLKNAIIIEVTNEIDQSKYLTDNTEKTNLLQQYQMPTIEIIYILQ